jgi:hypothetical protein
MDAMIRNNYSGEIEMPDGKKIKFSIKGTSKMEVESLLKNANPKMKVKFLKK